MRSEYSSSQNILILWRNNRRRQWACMFMCWIAWASHSLLRNQGINRFQSPTAPIGNMLQRGQNMEGTRQNRANIVIDDSGSPLLTRDTEFIHVLYNETTNSLVCTTKDRYLIVVVPKPSLSRRYTQTDPSQIHFMCLWMEKFNIVFKMYVRADLFS